MWWKAWDRARCGAAIRARAVQRRVVMARMVHELRGTPCIGREKATPDRKSIVAFLWPAGDDAR